MAEVKQVKVPDIGDFDAVPVIEVLVKPGDRIDKDQGLVTLESDKATMEVPAPFAGTVKEVKVKEGDDVAEGALIALVEADDAGTGDQKSGTGDRGPGTGSPTAADDSSPSPPSGGEGRGEEANAATATDQQSGRARQTEPSPPTPLPGGEGSKSADDSSTDAGARRAPPVPLDAGLVMPGDTPYASPAVRAFARELGVDISQVKGSGDKGRILRQDVQGWVKHALASGARPTGGGAASSGLQLLPWPQVDFSKFGEIEEQPLPRIRKISGANLARNWAMIPHVTQHDDADITEMEAFRKQLGAENKDLKLTPLVFLIKAVVAALKEYPQFNASLDAGGEKLVLKKYFHIGIAVDTPDGLVVPVLRDCDQTGLLDLARELGEISAKAREKKLAPGDMSGGCFSISSLGGIGGTGFTPIINAPEVAILGVSRSAMKPVWNGKEFAPRLILPLSLSYDHRVVDGAAAARFAAFLATALGDLRRLLL